MATVIYQTDTITTEEAARKIAAVASPASAYVEGFKPDKKTGKMVQRTYRRVYRANAKKGVTGKGKNIPTLDEQIASGWMRVALKEDPQGRDWVQLYVPGITLVRVDGIEYKVRG